MTRTEKLELIRNHSAFNYVYSPGDGRMRYVFDNWVAVGIGNALEFVRTH